MQSEFVLSSPSLGQIIALPTPHTQRVVQGPDRETGAQVDRGPRITKEGASLCPTSGPCALDSCHRVSVHLAGDA